MTKLLEKAFSEASKLNRKDQDAFASFLLEELAFRSAVCEGIEAADKGETVPFDAVKKMASKWLSE